ncbi:uncharacterized protein PAC_19160 [Phialocephala subalpina]|uniref:Uncharacterized protein n=1 Tax=Phialocephala subalpina TaxID=576137 RepID=A0A1L7XW84_9HELO|nr:uncharacterized protein PAC_19160 [Phialocephala subalpina]
MDNRDKPGVTTKIIAGGIAGASETMVTLNQNLPMPQVPRRICQNSETTPQFSHDTISSLSILKSTYHKSGILGFYSGCGALVVSNALKSGIRFLSFETSRDYLDRVFSSMQCQRSSWVNVLAGLSAGVAESLLVVSLGEALKTRMVEDAASKGSQRFARKGVVAIARVVVWEEGVGALWRGVLPVLCKQATNSALLNDDEMVELYFEPYHPVIDPTTKRKSPNKTGLAATMCEGQDTVVHIDDHLAKVALYDDLDVPFIETWSADASSKSTYLKATDTTKPTKHMTDEDEFGNKKLHPDPVKSPRVLPHQQTNLRSLLVGLNLGKLTYEDFLDGLSQEQIDKLLALCTEKQRRGAPGIGKATALVTFILDHLLANKVVGVYASSNDTVNNIAHRTLRTIENSDLTSQDDKLCMRMWSDQTESKVLQSVDQSNPTSARALTTTSPRLG